MCDRALIKQSVLPLSSIYSVLIMIIVYGKKNYILNLGRFDYLYRHIFNNSCGGSQQ